MKLLCVLGWMYDIHLLSPIEYTAPRVDPNRNSGFGGMSMMFQYSFTDYNQCTILMQDIDRGGCVCMETEGTLYFSPSFTMNLKLL